MAASSVSSATLSASEMTTKLYVCGTYFDDTEDGLLQAKAFLKQTAERCRSRWRSVPLSSPIRAECSTRRDPWNHMSVRRVRVTPPAAHRTDIELTREIMCRGFHVLTPDSQFGGEKEMEG